MKEKKLPVTNTHNALGRGMASLFPKAEASLRRVKPPVNENPIQETKYGAGISFVELHSIEANLYQPRRDFHESSLEELANSIRINGIIQPLVLRKVGKEGKRFQLIAGERRLRAAKKLALKHVPAIIRTSSDRESLEIALLENIQREDLNCVDVALSCFQLMEDFKLKQEEIAKRVCKKRSTVANHIRLLKLPEEIIEGLRKGQITFGHGKALLTLHDSMQMLLLYKEIIEKDLSVRKTEERTLSYLAKKSKNNKTVNEATEQRALTKMEVKISHHYGTRVECKGSEKKGKIIIRYFNREELNRLLDQLLGNAPYHERKSHE